MTTVEIDRKGSEPTSAHTVDFNRVVCILAQEAPSAKIFFRSVYLVPKVLSSVLMKRRVGMHFSR